MLSTLHSCSALGVKSDLELFSLPPTQFSHVDDAFTDIYPSSVAKPKASDVVEFEITNNSLHYLDISSIFVQIRARLLKADGTTTKLLERQKEFYTAAEAGTGADKKITITTHAAQLNDGDKVYLTDNIANSIIRVCDVYLNSKLVSEHELYTYRSYLDLLMRSNVAMRDTLWPLGFHPDRAAQTLDLVYTDGINARYKISAASKPFELEKPIFTDICQQGSLLLPGVNVRLVFRLNPDNFRIITAAGVTTEYKLDISRFKLRARFVQVADSIRLAHEEVLLKQPALYVLRGIETKIRSVPEGSTHIVLENLCPLRVPDKLTILFVETDAFYGSFATNPLKFEHLDMTRCSLYIGTKELRETFDFEQSEFATAFLNLCRAVGNPDFKLTRATYKDNTFLLHYNLKPDCSNTNFSPVRVENVRLHIQLKRPLTKAYTCIVVSETPRILEIKHDRTIELKK